MIKTITDNIIDNEVSGINDVECLIDGKSPTNILEIDFRANKNRVHEAQKPVALMEYLIRLTTYRKPDRARSLYREWHNCNRTP